MTTGTLQVIPQFHSPLESLGGAYAYQGNALVNRRTFQPNGPDDVLRGREFLQRVASAEIVNTFYRGPADIDNITGETWEMRVAYRRLMLKEPAVKAALISKVQSVAAMDPQLIPDDPNRPVDKAAAKFVDWAIQRSHGGWQKLIESIALPALIDGYSLSEKLFDITRSEQYGGFWTLKKLYSLDTKYVRFDIDKYKDIVNVRQTKTMPATALDPRDFVIFQHMQLFESPFGISDLRAAYRAASMIESAIKLRAILLENFSGPFLWAKYPQGDQGTKQNLEEVLAKARSLGWAVMPEDAEMQVMNLATSAPDQFQASIEDLRKEIYTALQGSYLAFTEAKQGVERGDTSEQASINEIFRVWLAGSVCEVVNRQVIPDLVYWNYGETVGLPRLQLGGMNIERVQKQLEIFRTVGEMTGGDVSKKQIYDMARVERATDDADRLTPAQPPGGAAPGLPPGPGGGPGMGGDPAMLPAGPDAGGGAPADPTAAMSDDSEHPVRFLGHDHDDAGTVWPPAGDIEGRKLAAILDPSINAFATLVGEATRAGLNVELPNYAATSVWTDKDRKVIVEQLAALLTVSDLLACGRLSQHADGVEVRKFADAGYDLFGKSGDVPFSFVPRAMRPHRSVESAIDYIMSLVPIRGVSPLHLADGWRRKAFTLAVDLEYGILEKVKRAVVGELYHGEDATAEIRDILNKAGVNPANPDYPRMVARTNAMDAYCTGFHNQLQSPETHNDFPVWQYCGIRDGRQGEDHEPQFDKYYPSTVDFAEVRGPRVYNCRCLPRPIYKLQWAKLRDKGTQTSDLPAWAAPASLAFLDQSAPVLRYGSLLCVAAELADEIKPERLALLLTRLADHPGEYAAAAGLPAPATRVFHGGVYDESLHPRDDHGRWIDKADLASARVNSAKAAELRSRVTKPAERAKLDHVLGSDHPIGTPPDKAAGKRLGAKVRAGKATPSEQRDLFHHLPAMSHEDLRDVRDAVESTPLQQTNAALDARGKVADHVREASATMDRASHPAYATLGKVNADGAASKSQTRYGKDMKATLDAMPMAALDRIATNVKQASLHNDHAAVGDAAVASVMSKNYLTPEMKQKATNYKAAFDAGKLKPAAVFLPKSGILHLSGGGSQVYAHALGHAIDGPSKEISSSPGWERAWKAEIAGKLSETPKLNRYAQGNPSEGFAEFARLVYGSDHPAAAIEAKFPLAAAVLKNHGLWDDTPRFQPDKPDMTGQSGSSDQTGFPNRVGYDANANATLKAPWQMTPEESKASGMKYFRTGQGSIYALHPTTGQTLRVKSLHKGHEVTDVGLKRSSEKTIYMDPEHATEVGMWQQGQGPTKKRVLVGKDKITLINYWKDFNNGKGKWDKIELPFTTEMKVGMSPLELNDKRTSESIGMEPGLEMWSGTHPGNAITEIVDHDIGHDELVKGAAQAGQKTWRDAQEDTNPTKANVKLNDVFGERVALDTKPNGDHVDTLGASHRPEDGTPVNPTNEHVYTVPTSSLQVDPFRFQYKVAGIGGDGVSNKLSKVTKWDPNLGGVSLVWRDPADGKDYVVNGHHRKELADRVGQGSMNVRYIDAPNHRAARAIGALANIAEGNGKAIDAAKFMRDSKKTVQDLKQAGLAPNSKMVQDAAALVNLGDRPFQMVTEGRLDEETAVAVAKHLHDPEAQDALFKKIRDRENAGNEWTPRQIEIAAKKLAGAGKTRIAGGGDLFGDIEGEQSTFDQEVELEGFASKKLGLAKREYGTLANKNLAERTADAGNQLNLNENARRRKDADDSLENFEKFARLKSNTSALVREHAAKLAAIGEHGSYVKKNDVRDAFFAALPAALEADLSGKPAPAEPERTSPPAPAASTGSSTDADSAQVLEPQGATSSPVEPAATVREDDLFGPVGAGEAEGKAADGRDGDLGGPRADTGGDVEKMTKAEAKAKLDSLPVPEKLEEDHGKYFNVDPDKHPLVPVDKINSTRARPEGIANAAKFMAAAAAGVMPKRDPIKVVDNGDGTYDVADGNSTFNNAQKHGWKSMPVQLVDRSYLDAEREKTAQKEMAKVAPAIGTHLEEHKDLPSKVVTPHASGEELFAHAAESKPQYDKILNTGGGVDKAIGAKAFHVNNDEEFTAAINHPGPIVLIGGIKGQERATEKVNADYGGNWGMLHDAIRGTVAVDTMQEVPAALEALKKHMAAQGWSVVKKPKNRVDHPTDAGYRDIMLNFQAPNGMISEVQIATKPMMQAKGMPGHQLYAKMRSIEAAAKLEGRDMTPEELSQYNELADAQKKLYSAAHHVSLGAAHHGELDKHRDNLAAVLQPGRPAGAEGEGGVAAGADDGVRPVGDVQQPVRDDQSGAADQPGGDGGANAGVAGAGVTRIAQAAAAEYGVRRDTKLSVEEIAKKENPYRAGTPAHNQFNAEFAKELDRKSINVGEASSTPEADAVLAAAAAPDPGKLVLKTAGGKTVDAIPGDTDDRLRNSKQKRLERLPDDIDQLYAEHDDAEPDDREGIKNKIKQLEDERDRLTDELAEPGAAKAADDPLLTPHVELANTLADHMKEHGQISAKELFAHADKHHGGTRAAGKYGQSEAYDSLETAMNMNLAGNSNPAAGLEDAKAQAEEIAKQVKSLPTQTNRTGNKDEFQQFSTPPHYAFAAAWLANIKPGDQVLEPSAGTGSLAVHAANAGGHVIANELDPKRADLLRHQFGHENVHTENAEQISGILPGRGVKPSVVVMNPPFSSTAGRVDKKDLLTGAKHISEALEMLPEGGRLVAIVGRGMAPDKPTYRKWFNDLREKYGLKANVGVTGKEYTKYGTSFDTRMLVIDKDGPHKGETVTGDVDTIPELMDKLEGVRNGRPGVGGAEQAAGVPTGGADDTAARGAAGSAKPAPEPTPDALAAEATAGGGDPGRGGRDRAGATGDGGAAAATGGDADAKLRGNSPRGGAVDRPAEQSAGDSAVSARDLPIDAGKQDVPKRGKAPRGKPTQQPGGSVPKLGTSAPVPIRVASPEERMSAQQVANKARSGDDANPDSLYETYRPSKLRVDGAQKHPSALVESAAMASVEPPDPTYSPHFPAEVVKNGMLSEAALESVVYAGQNHESYLEGGVDGEPPMRRGYFIGDGTGAGKGRQIAGIMTDNNNQGRDKHVWVSLKSPLIQDARRDYRDLGNDENDVHDFDKIRGAAPPDKGVAFITYDTLKGKPRSSQTAQKNLDKLVDWLGGENFHGVIAFDESHAMANAIGSKGLRGDKDASQRALAGVELQRKLPNARVVYVSATGATEVSNLAYADRLGLWGKGTAFTDKKEFIGAMEKGGVAAMEAVAQSMKAQGMYGARSLAMDDGTPNGKVTYDRLTHSLTEDQRQVYDASADAWQEVLKNIDQAIESIGADSRGKAAAYSQFWGQQQRFFNQVMTSMQTESVIKDMEQQLHEGKSPVIQLVNTMESAMNRAVDAKTEGQEYEDLDVSPREMLMQYLEKSFPTQRYEDTQDADGNVIRTPVKDSEGNPVHDPKALAMRDAMMDKVGSLRIPESPIDRIINHFGHENVAECTGRSKRLIDMTGPDGVKARRLDRRPGSSNITEAQHFQDGKKKILVFSDAGGTGRSYHADKNAKNQAQRVHYMLQPGWRADNAVQGLGRTHRTNQSSAPVFRLVEIAELKAQRRFVSTIARRLDQLGAITRGQRQAGSSGLFKATDNLESAEAKKALGRFFTDLQSGRMEGMNFGETMQKLGFKPDKDGAYHPEKVTIPQFLNRLLSLKVDDQNHVFDHFERRLHQTVEEALAAGDLDTGVENFKAHSIVPVGNVTVNKDARTGAEAKLLTVRAIKKLEKRKFEHTRTFDKPHSYVQSARTGSVYAVYPTSDRTDPDTGVVTRNYRLVNATNGPGKMQDREQIDRARYQGGTNWRHLDENEAKQLWDKEYADAPDTVEQNEHFVTGAILPIWDRIPGVYPKIYKLQMSDGTQAVGRHLNGEGHPEAFARAMGVDLAGNKVRDDLDAEDVHAKLSAGTHTAELANGWKLKPVRIQGERRIELLNAGLSHHDELASDGALRERIAYATRHFIPTGEAGVEVMKRITKHRPVIEAKPLRD